MNVTWSKRQVISIIAAASMLIVASFIVGMNTTKNEYEKQFVTISFNKDYNVLTVPPNLKAGVQYDYVVVENLLATDGQLYGVLTVNETTNKIQFLPFNVSNETGRNINVTWSK